MVVTLQMIRNLFFNLFEYMGMLSFSPMEFSPTSMA